jgi:hypothetical protein
MTLPVTSARKRFMLEEIDSEDYKAIKTECNKTLTLLESKLAATPSKTESLKTIEGLLDIVIGKYTDVQLHYNRASISEKRKLISSIYPKNLCFDGIKHRTFYISRPLAFIMQINKQLQTLKD